MCLGLRASHNGRLPAESHLTDRVCRARGRAHLEPASGPVQTSSRCAPHATDTPIGLRGGQGTSAAGGEGGNDRAWTGRVGVHMQACIAPPGTGQSWRRVRRERNRPWAEGRDLHLSSVQGGLGPGYGKGHLWSQRFQVG